MRELRGVPGPIESARTERPKATARRRARADVESRPMDAPPPEAPAEAAGGGGGDGAGTTTLWAIGGGVALVGGGLLAATSGGGANQPPPPPADTTPPAAPTITLAADTGRSASDGVTRNGSITVAGLEAGARWEYSVDGGASWSAGSGTGFTVPAGSYAAGAIRVRQADAANNLSPAAAIAGALIVDTTNPAAPGIAAITGDNIVGESERSAGVTVSGTAEPGSRVTVTWGATSKEVDANNAGAWSASFVTAEIPAALGASSITAGATDAAGNASPLAAQAISLVPTIGLSGQLVAGPVIAGSGLTVDLYRGDGTLLKAGVAVGANGSFATDVDVATGDVVVARVRDPDAGADFLDEATGASKDLDAQLLAVGTAQGGAITLNINPLTTIAARKAGLAADGSGSVSEASVTAANLAVAKAFGLAGIDLTRTNVTPTNGGSYDPANGLTSGERIGAVLAAMSGADATAASMQATIDALVAAVTTNGNDGVLAAAGMATLLAGASRADGAVAGGLQTEMSNLLAAAHSSTRLTIAAVATDNIVNAAEAPTLQLSGSVGANATGVTVTIAGRAVAATVSGRTWSYLLSDADRAALADDGAVVMQAQARFGDGSTATASRAVIVDRAAPAAPVLATIGVEDRVGAAQKLAGVTLSGTAEPGSSVQIDWAGAGKTVATAIDGSWSASFAAAEVPVDGSRIVSVVAVDAGGNAGPATARAIQIDTIAPAAPVIAAIAANDSVGPVEAQSDLTLTGTAEANAIVRVSWGSVTKIVTAGGDGIWSAGFAPGEIPADGATTVSARQTDLAGNTSIDSQRAVLVARAPATIVLAGTAGDETITRAEALAGVTISGIAPAGSRIELSWGSVARTASADANGDWSFAFDSAGLPGDGATTLTVNAFASDGSAAGSASRPVLIDTVAPAPATLDPVATDQIVSAAEKAAGVALSGTADPNAPVEIVWGGTTRRVNADADGRWSTSVAPAQVPADGETTLVVRQFDAVGNQSADLTRTVRVDSAAPAAPPIALQSDTGSLDNDGLSRVGTMAVTGLEPDASWDYSIDGGANWSPGSGTSFVLPEGDYPAGTILVRQTDVAGNTSAAALNGSRIEIDQSPPEPSMDEIAGDGVVNAAERAAGMIIFGQSEPGAAVTVTWNGASRSVTATADGLWSVAFAPSEVPDDGVTTVTASSTDRAGNAAVVVANATVRVDTVTPPVPTIALVADTGRSGSDRVTSDGRIAISGLEAGAIWESSLDGGVSWVEGGGIQLDLGDGSYAALGVLVRQVDAAGNASAAVDLGQALVIDTAVAEPLIGEIAGDGIVSAAEKEAGVAVSGSAEANAIVTIAWGDTTKTLLADTTGAWSATFSAAEIPAAGTTDVSARATDVAGNVSATATRPVTVEAAKIGAVLDALFAAGEPVASGAMAAWPAPSARPPDWHDAGVQLVVI
jgi:hypothetical protein